MVEEVEKTNGWKIVGILFIILFILSIIISIIAVVMVLGLVGLGIDSYESDCSKLCNGKNSEISSYVFTEGVCYCYSGCELVHEEFLE